MMLDRNTSPRLGGSGIQESRPGLSAELVAGFLPAFRHRHSGEVRLCRAPGGGIAWIHVLDSLPGDWVVERDGEGRPTVLLAAVEAGFLRGDQFWRLEDLAHPTPDS